MNITCRVCKRKFVTSVHSQRICFKCRPEWWGKATKREKGNFSSRGTVPLRFQEYICKFCCVVFVPTDKRKICSRCRPDWFDKATTAEKDRYSGDAKTLVPLRFQKRSCRECASVYVPDHASSVICINCRPAWWSIATENERSNWTMIGNIPVRFQEIKSCEVCSKEFAPSKQNEKFCSVKCRHEFSRNWYKQWEGRLYEKYPWRKLVARMRGRLNAAIKQQKVEKTDPTMKIVGMSGKELMIYLLSHPNNKDGLFTPENYGDVWQVDHIVPLAYFDLSQQDQLYAAFHYTNCQPLSCSDNNAKGSFFNGVRHRHGSRLISKGVTVKKSSGGKKNK